MEAIWNWLNGNKTIFGLVLLQIASGIDPAYLLFGFIPLQTILNWAGGLLAGGGIVHKLSKSNTEPGPNA